MKTCILSYHWKLDICNYEAFIKHRIVSIVKVVPTKMLSSFWGGAIAPAVPIAFPSMDEAKFEADERKFHKMWDT